MMYSMEVGGTRDHSWQDRFWLASALMSALARLQETVGSETCPHRSVTAAQSPPLRHGGYGTRGHCHLPVPTKEPHGAQALLMPLAVEVLSHESARQALRSLASRAGVQSRGCMPVTIAEPEPGPLPPSSCDQMASLHPLHVTQTHTTAHRIGGRRSPPPTHTHGQHAPFDGFGL